MDCGSGLSPHDTQLPELPDHRVRAPARTAGAQPELTLAVARALPSVSQEARCLCHSQLLPASSRESSQCLPGPGYGPPPAWRSGVVSPGPVPRSLWVGYPPAVWSKHTAAYACQGLPRGCRPRGGACSGSLVGSQGPAQLWSWTRVSKVFQKGRRERWREGGIPPQITGHPDGGGGLSMRQKCLGIEAPLSPIN